MSSDKLFTTIDEINQPLAPLLRGLIGMRVTACAPERVVALFTVRPDLCAAGGILPLTVRPDLCTAGGILHGGAYMAFADTIGAVTTVLNLPPNKRTLTVESKTNFIGGAAVGSKVIGECTPFHRGNPTMVWQTVVKNEAGKTVAAVSQTQFVIPL